jgi:hypothetical protein
VGAAGVEVAAGDAEGSTAGSAEKARSRRVEAAAAALGCAAWRRRRRDAMVGTLGHGVWQGLGTFFSPSPVGQAFSVLAATVLQNFCSQTVLVVDWIWLKLYMTKLLFLVIQKILFLFKSFDLLRCGLKYNTTLSSLSALIWSRTVSHPLYKGAKGNH